VENYRKYTFRHLKKRKNFLNSISITNLFIIINILIFLLINIFILFKRDLISYFAVNPFLILQGKYIWTLLTSVFTHIQIWHLFVNMISLMFIGNFVEKIIGKRRYTWFYVLSGIFASLFFVFFALLFNQNINIPAVGASGALFALGGLLMILLPRLKVYVFFFIPMPLWIGMIFMLGVLWWASIGVGLPIGNTAHLGGLIIGVLYGLYLKKRYSKKITLLNRMFG
jgi:hypothetical protein